MNVLLTNITIENWLVMLLGILCAYHVPEFVTAVIGYKESKRASEYSIYDQDSKYQRVLVICLISIMFFIQSILLSGVELVITLILSFIAIVAMQIDRRVRIIPNELVLLILLGSFMRQIIHEGVTGIVSGLVSMLIVGVIFFMASNISKAYYGHAGVGAGDIKLTMAMSVYFGTTHVFVFMMSIAIVLLVYISYGFLYKKYTMMTTFPMGLQITYGFLIALIVIQVI